MIKIPGTDEGLPAIEQAIADGYNVNITLLFSGVAYGKVMQAYIKGLERRQAAGEELGLPAETARLLALQTAFGAAQMALESSDDAGTLRHHVTSPGGTTERAIDILRDGGLMELISQAVKGAAERSSELAREYGKDS